MDQKMNLIQSFSEKLMIDVKSLEEMVSIHPASNLARLLLLNQYNKTDSHQFENYIKQCTPYFNNPHWLFYQLNKKDTIENVTPELLSEDLSHFAISFPNGNERADDATESVANNMDIKLDTAIMPEEKMIEENISIENNFIYSDNTDSVNEINNNELETANLPLVEIEENNLPESEDGSEIAKEEMIEISEPNPEIDTPETVGEKETVSSTEIQQNEEEIIPEIKEEAISFEPLHTIDYFASQGIKIKEESLMNDKLGKQMKSFTEWLKSMKKLHPGKLPEQNEVVEKIIQTSAEVSNVDAEVLTEAMAEVLLKQNKQEKAIEMYQKLSLMNPSKSAYFAAKIENIKTL